MKTNGLGNIRLPVLLPAGLHARLVRYAAREGISLSEAARRAIQAGLIVPQDATKPDRGEQLRNLAAMRRTRDKVLARFGVCQGDLVAEARAERERQMDEVMWGQDDGE